MATSLLRNDKKMHTHAATSRHARVSERTTHPAASCSSVYALRWRRTCTPSSRVGTTTSSWGPCIAVRSRLCDSARARHARHAARQPSGSAVAHSERSAAVAGQAGAATGGLTKSSSQSPRPALPSKPHLEVVWVGIGWVGQLGERGQQEGQRLACAWQSAAYLRGRGTGHERGVHGLKTASRVRAGGPVVLPPARMLPIQASIASTSMASWAR